MSESNRVPPTKAARHALITRAITRYTSCIAGERPINGSCSSSTARSSAAVPPRLSAAATVRVSVSRSNARP